MKRTKIWRNTFATLWQDLSFNIEIIGIALVVIALYFGIPFGLGYFVSSFWVSGTVEEAGVKWISNFVLESSYNVNLFFGLISIMGTMTITSIILFVDSMYKRYQKEKFRIYPQATDY